MPVYTIQQDPPWAHKPGRPSYAPSASVYSEDYEGQVLDHPDMPQVAPLQVQKPHHPPYHAHPEQQIKDRGPQGRGSRLPIFKQVRSMLHKPPASDTRGNPKYDEFTGDLSENGRAPQIKPSTYRNPYEGVYQTRRQHSPNRKLQKKAKSVRSISPVSVLREDEIAQSPPSQNGWDGEYLPSPVSPVSAEFPPPDSRDSDRTLGPTSQAAVNARTLPATPPNPSTKLIERKPAPSSRSSPSPETVPPQHNSAPKNGLLSAIPEADMEQYDPGSHFSWTTTATSPAPLSPVPKHSQQPSGEILLPSRFSWSTVKTQTTTQERQLSSPSPPPPLPTQYKTPPVQSILSRHRPVQRLEKDVWTPPQRKVSSPDSAVNTPKSAKSKITIDFRASQENGTGSAKKLPPPPELSTTATPMSHLEALLAEEKDKVRQRRNIERAIVDLEKKEQASPMEVSFAELKNAKKRLGEMKTTLAEIQLEERDIGIAISRARRKEGEEEGLWVRRVTG